MGHSYGGYMSLMAVLRYPDLIQVAVAGAPPTDWPVQTLQLPTDEGGQVRGWFAKGQPGHGAVLLLHGVYVPPHMAPHARSLPVELRPSSLTHASAAGRAERARRAQVMEAEGRKRSVELAADAALYAAEQEAKARRVTADAEAYATGVIAAAIAANGLEAAQFQIAQKQVAALAEVAKGNGQQTILIPTQALEAFADAFKMLKGRG
jgi:pimeloyl-ACP methyl ester carboxylesterase